MSNIPLARDLLLRLADEIDEPYSFRVRNIVETMMVKRSAVRRAPTKSVPVTEAIAKAVRKMAKKYPTMHQSEIALVFGLNQGRVSEILSGRKDEP